MTKLLNAFNRTTSKSNFLDLFGFLVFRQSHYCFMRDRFHLSRLVRRAVLCAEIVCENARAEVRGWVFHELNQDRKRISPLRGTSAIKILQFRLSKSINPRNTKTFYG